MTLDDTMTILRWAKDAGATTVKVGSVAMTFQIPNSKSETDVLRDRASQIMNRESGSDARAYFDKQLFGASLDKAE